MKSITFRPLRLHKKSGKIMVASYMGWRKISCADYNKFNLVVSDEYKAMKPSEYVYNHEGEQLFFFTYNPADIPMFVSSEVNLEEVFAKTKVRGFIGSGENRNHYSGTGIDCDGVPTFSHYTANGCTHYDDINQFEPLTVGMVTKWLGWFLYQLENSYLQIGK